MGDCIQLEIRAGKYGAGIRRDGNNARRIIGLINPATKNGGIAAAARGCEKNGKKANSRTYEP